MLPENLTQNDLALLLAVARMYYDGQQTQQDIADNLGLSRSKVSRLLSRALDVGIARVIVHNPFSQAIDLSSKLKRAFNLDEVIVTPNLLDNQTIISRELGKAAARYIETHLPHNAVVGIGRGRSVSESVKTIQTRIPGRSPTVVPVAGGMGPADSLFPASENARLMAQRLKGECVFIYAPAIVRKKAIKQAILDEYHTSKAVSLWGHLDWVIAGVGEVPIEGAKPGSEYIIALEDFTRRIGIEPVADLCSWFVLSDGSIPLTECASRVIGASPKQMVAAKVRMAIAGGSSKASAIAGVLKTGIPNVLVTDESAALAIVAAL